MAGDIFQKEGTLATLEENGGSLATITAVAAVDATNATFDLRSGGVSGATQNTVFQFELVCQWGTITGIAKDTVAAELYIVPALDGTNYPDVDTTGGSSVLPQSSLKGTFVCTKAPSVSTNMRFMSPEMTLRPFLYKAYILNRSGQTISAGWTLKVMSSRNQYT